MTDATQIGLAFLLNRIGSWTEARWDQHLRHEFGDDIANLMIAEICTTVPAILNSK